MTERKAVTIRTGTRARKGYDNKEKKDNNEGNNRRNEDDRYYSSIVIGRDICW
jgi:hypothetical protein